MHAATGAALPTFQPPLLDLERQLIVKLKPGSSGDRVAATGVDPLLGVTLRSAPPPPDGGSAVAPSVLHGRLEPGASLAQALQELNAREDVEWAVEDHIILPARTPNDPLYYKQWAMQRVGAEAAWDLSVGGAVGASKAPPRRAPPPVPPPRGNATYSANVVVCIVDSGIDFQHPQLAASMLPEVGWNSLDPALPPLDKLGHGTHVAGIVVSSSNDDEQVAGLTWGPSSGSAVRLLACKFMSDQARELSGYGYTSNAVACLDYCLARGADIISASWSAGTAPNPPLEEAVGRAERRGVLLVAAAGNHGFYLSEVATYPASYGLNHSLVLTVGASGVLDEWADYASWDERAVHLSAPGATILSTWPGGFVEYSSGTSMAAPFVSGAAALLLAASGKRLTALQAKQVLLETAEKLESHQGSKPAPAQRKPSPADTSPPPPPKKRKSPPPPPPPSPLPKKRKSPPPPPPPKKTINPQGKRDKYKPCKKGSSKKCKHRCVKQEETKHGKRSKECGFYRPA
ncbi:hypothetical protein CHLNCDRAFT_134105 [Chlorella variabilis]|uniref:Peptidase S8/S53 domain-containing protein n=1 Tax=Chlorella variabilis TaxID=554065 RepID=E1ZF05_CHLVA|nr:hypothetical protein CHLNCDRAFT_134105 [Chlorella variabilis]EFN55753.1 hypothetical protein CHLNCDRAFT_134105 [Chlorella variabilis]|eukprot:XP_005847855.1 hypothetical protein CHLNCDRAFT_134105 [Chlorella variabilis]